MSFKKNNSHLYIPHLSILNNNSNSDNKANHHSRNQSTLSNSKLKGLSATARKKIKAIPQLSLPKRALLTNSNNKPMSLSPKKHLPWLTSRNKPISSLSSEYMHTNRTLLNKNPKYDSLTKRENALSDKKRKIKAKMMKLMHDWLIINQDIVDKMKLNFIYEKGIKSNKNKLKNKKRPLFVVNTKGVFNEFTQINPHYRFEDCYFTPSEFLNKNFNDEEIKTITSDPKFFSLDKRPFIGSEVNIHLSLIDKLNKEDEERNKDKENRKKNKCNTIKTCNNDYNNNNSNNIIKSTAHTKQYITNHSDNGRHITPKEKNPYSHHISNNRNNSGNIKQITTENIPCNKHSKHKRRVFSSIEADNNPIIKPTQESDKSLEHSIVKKRLNWFDQMKSKNQQKKVEEKREMKYIRKIISMIKYNYTT